MKTQLTLLTQLNKKDDWCRQKDLVLLDEKRYIKNAKERGGDTHRESQIKARYLSSGMKSASLHYMISRGRVVRRNRTKCHYEYKITRVGKKRLKELRGKK